MWKDFQILFVSVLGWTLRFGECSNCSTIVVRISEWTDVDANLSATFEGTYQESPTETAYGRGVWEDRTETNKRIYFLLSTWIIQNDNYDYLSYDSGIGNSIPPIGTYELTHGEITNAASVETVCYDTYVPSLNPTLLPSYNPSNEPSSNPSYNPSSMPTNNPSFNPSSMPTNIPTVLPTPECNIIELFVNESTIEYYNSSMYDSTNEENLISDINNDNGWAFWPKDTEFNNRAQWTFNNDNYNGLLQYKNNDWTLTINSTNNDNTFVFVDTSGSIRKVPNLLSIYAGETLAIEFKFDCFGSWYPSNIPTYVPSLQPSDEPTLGPSEMPTEPSLSPTYAPTERCNTLYVNILAANFNVFGTNNSNSQYLSVSPNGLFLLAGINGSYTLQNTQVNERPWYIYDLNSNIWIEWGNGAWWFLNPTQKNLNFLTSLYYESNDKQPPLDDPDTPITDANVNDFGYWWNVNNDDDDNKIKLYIICDYLTSPPTLEPVESVTTTQVTTQAVFNTTEESIITTEAAEQTTESERYLGLSLIEWFVIIFLLFLCCITIIGVWWYREYKKAQIIENEKNKKLSARNDEEIDENELFGASHRANANAPNNVRPNVSNQPSHEMTGQKPKLSYVSEGDNELKGTGKPAAGSWENALMIATSHKNDAPI